MKKLRMLLALMLTLAMVTVMIAGCSSSSSDDTDDTDDTSTSEDEDAEDEEESTAEAGSIVYPLEDAVETITWYAQSNLDPHEVYADYTESPFHTGLSELVGVDIEWSFPTAGSDTTTFTNTLLADPTDLPDIMTIYIMEDAQQYIDDGIIWDLTDYIQEYAPDYYAWLQTNEAYDKAMKTDEGSYYAFGFFREDGGWNDSYLGFVVRTDWLEECGLEIPTTISELENVIRVFNEVYGATFDAAWSRIYYTGFSGAFGAYGFSYSDYSWYISEDGEVGLGQAEDEWRDQMSWINGLWEEGLIDQDILSEDDTTIQEKTLTGLCGISYTSMGQLNNWNKTLEANGEEAVWVGISFPTSDDGEISSVFGGPGIGNQTTVITTSASEEEMITALQILNYAYTEEGNLYWNYGTEGVSWEYDEDGVPTWTDLVADDTDTDPMTKYNGATWGAPCIQATNLLYLKNSQVSIDANDTWYYVYPDDEEANTRVTSGWRYPIGVTFTTEESDEMDEISGNISTFVSESCTSFMTGTLDIDDDSVWEQYLEDLETYNLSRILEIRQDAYERYLAR